MEVEELQPCSWQAERWQRDNNNILLYFVMERARPGGSAGLILTNMPLAVFVTHLNTRMLTRQELWYPSLYWGLSISISVYIYVSGVSGFRNMCTYIYIHDMCISLHMICVYAGWLCVHVDLCLSWSSERAPITEAGTPLPPKACGRCTRVCRASASDEVGSNGSRPRHLPQTRIGSPVKE